MSGSLAIDFGVNVPGESGVVLTSSALAAAYLLHKQVTVITQAIPNGIVLLPQSYAAGTSVRIKNRSSYSIMASPGATNQIENYGIGVAVSIASLADMNLVSFDPPASPAPRTWWIDQGTSGPPSTSGLANDGGVVISISNIWPTTAAGSPGTLWSNSGVLNIIPGYMPVTPAISLVFATTSASTLLAANAAALPVSTINPPPPNSGIIYVVGQELWVA